MNDRHRYALANPINGGEPDLDPYRSVDVQPDGNTLAVILAVDR